MRQANSYYFQDHKASPQYQWFLMIRNELLKAREMEEKLNKEMIMNEMVTNEKKMIDKLAKVKLFSLNFFDFIRTNQQFEQKTHIEEIYSNLLLEALAGKGKLAKGLSGAINSTIYTAFEGEGKFIFELLQNSGTFMHFYHILYQRESAQFYAFITTRTYK